MKEQQKLLENVLTQQLGSGSSHELLAQALKNMLPQVQVCDYVIYTEVWEYSSTVFIDKLQVTDDVDPERSHDDQQEIDPVTNKPVFLVPTDSPGRRSVNVFKQHERLESHIYSSTSFSFIDYCMVLYSVARNFCQGLP